MDQCDIADLQSKFSHTCCLVYFIGLRLARGLVTWQTRRDALAAKQHDERQGDQGEYSDRDSRRRVS